MTPLAPRSVPRAVPSVEGAGPGLWQRPGSPARWNRPAASLRVWRRGAGAYGCVMADSIILADHAGAPLVHGKPRVNGVEIHYAIGGTGEPVFLLHGVPKTMLYWRRVVPRLTPHYTVVAMDNRGFGGSQRPAAGYDTATMAGDVAGLATRLGFEQFRFRSRPGSPCSP
jgi:hypothetical protein